MNLDALQATAVLLGGPRHGNVVPYQPWSMQMQGHDSVPGYRFAEFNYGPDRQQYFGYPSSMPRADASRMATERFKHLLLEEFARTANRRLKSVSDSQAIEFWEMVGKFADLMVKDRVAKRKEA